jgi:hypothetical protein
MAYILLCKFWASTSKSSLQLFAGIQDGHNQFLKQISPRLTKTRILSFY